MAKNIKKELKRPDQFVSFWTQFWADVAGFAAARKRALAIGATALATVVVGSIIFAQVAEHRAAKASAALQRVEKIATAELQTTDAAPRPDDGVPHFKTAKERVEAALKDLDDSKVAEPGNPLRAEALLLRGGFLLDLDRADEARAVYDQLVSGGKLDPNLRFLAREGLGYSYERKGDLAQAAATFAKLGEDASAMGGFYQDRAGYHKARLAELQGNRDEAARLYHEVLDKSPTTSLRDEITNRLAVLELK